VAVAILVGLAALALPGRTAFAFCRTTTCAVASPPASCTRDVNTGCWQSGIPLQWSQQCISYAVNTAGSPSLGLDYSAAAAIVDGAFNHWPTASCSDGGSPSVAFMGRTGLTCDRVEYNPTGPNANAILFRDDGWTHDLTAYALTTVAFNTRTGQILDADMEINSASLTVGDIDFVVTHESGHFLGLDHSSNPAAVMFFQYGGGAVVPQLSDDDIEAICTAYPTSRSTPACDFEPPKGYATDCGGDVIAACAIAPEPLSAEVTSSPAGSSSVWFDGAAIGALGLSLAVRRRRRGSGR
jgi:MYXO-CTERM domain-containing protein